MDLYTFEGKAGDVALIVATDTSLPGSDLYDLVVEVFDSQGRSVARGQDDNRVTLTFNLAATGRYSTVVSDSGRGVAHTGTYALVLRNVASGVGIPISYGGTVLGEIKPAGNVDMYTFVGKAGDVALVMVTSTSGLSLAALMPFTVFDPQGRPVGIWQTPFTLPVAGKYSILIAGSRTSEGKYTIVLQKLVR